MGAMVVVLFLVVALYRPDKLPLSVLSSSEVYRWSPSPGGDCDKGESGIEGCLTEFFQAQYLAGRTVKTIQVGACDGHYCEQPGDPLQRLMFPGRAPRLSVDIRASLDRFEGVFLEPVPINFEELSAVVAKLDDISRHSRLTLDKWSHMS